MKLLLVVMVAVVVLARADDRQQAESCPMHKQHMADANFQSINARGESHAGMGFSQTATTHHFVVSEAGGAIEVTAKKAEDTVTIAQIRSHMTHIATVFAQGDFTIPMFVHDQSVPGAETMARLKEQISYRAEEIPNGARVLIMTKNPDAVAAVHEFLDFQIEEHRTGDHQH